MLSEDWPQDIPQKYSFRVVLKYYDRWATSPADSFGTDETIGASPP